jgi:hypothetical protein
MKNGTETTTEYQVEALENGAWRIFEVTTTGTVPAVGRTLYRGDSRDG